MGPLLMVKFLREECAWAAARRKRSEDSLALAEWLRGAHVFTGRLEVILWNAPLNLVYAVEVDGTRNRLASPR
jgi:hypothetical protein